jgi:hypothetical protein
MPRPILFDSCIFGRTAGEWGSSSSNYSPEIYSCRFVRRGRGYIRQTLRLWEIVLRQDHPDIPRALITLQRRPAVRASTQRQGYILANRYSLGRQNSRGITEIDS